MNLHCFQIHFNKIIRFCFHNVNITILFFSFNFTFVFVQFYIHYSFENKGIPYSFVTCIVPFHPRLNSPDILKIHIPHRIYSLSNNHSLSLFPLVHSSLLKLFILVDSLPFSAAILHKNKLVLGNSRQKSRLLDLPYIQQYTLGVLQ